LTCGAGHRLDWSVAIPRAEPSTARVPMVAGGMIRWKDSPDVIEGDHRPRRVARRRRWRRRGRMESFRKKHRRTAHMDDLRKLLAAGAAQAPPSPCIGSRQNAGYSRPEPDIYREYGLEDGQGCKDISDAVWPLQHAKTGNKLLIQKQKSPRHRA